MKSLFRCCILILLFPGPEITSGQDSICCITPGQSKIEARVNQSFVIKLRSCHSCGNHWYLELRDSLKVKLISVRYENASGRTSQKGGEVFEFWKLSGVKPGSSTVGFVQRGPARDHREIGRVKFDIWVNWQCLNRINENKAGSFNHIGSFPFLMHAWKTCRHPIHACSMEGPRFTHELFR